MKQIIVMIAAVMVGVSIYGMIAGVREDSIYSAVKGAWNREIEVRTVSP